MQLGLLVQAEHSMEAAGLETPASCLWLFHCKAAEDSPTCERPPCICPNEDTGERKCMNIPNVNGPSLKTSC